jgi:hypothetical protein
MMMMMMMRITTRYHGCSCCIMILQLLLLLMLMMLLLHCPDTATAAAAWTPARSSTFMGVVSRIHSHSHPSHSPTTMWTMYQNHHDEEHPSNSPPDHPHNNNNNNNNNPPNAWSVLSNTERWISRTLAHANRGGGDSTSTPPSSSSSSSSRHTNNKNPQMNNPYARKEVSYACESSTSAILVVASWFRQLQEMRTMGETHVAMELARERRPTRSSSSGGGSGTYCVCVPFCFSLFLYIYIHIYVCACPPISLLLLLLLMPYWLLVGFIIIIIYRLSTQYDASNTSHGDPIGRGLESILCTI